MIIQTTKKNAHETSNALKLYPNNLKRQIKTLLKYFTDQIEIIIICQQLQISTTAFLTILKFYLIPKHRYNASLINSSAKKTLQHQ